MASLLFATCFAAADAPDFSWAPASYAPAESPLSTKYFNPELRLDTSYHYEFSNPADDTIAGSSEVFRHNELQTTHVGFGGDFAYQNVGVRLMTQFGMYSTTTSRNDPSPSRGQWALDDAYRYLAEAYASYHLDVLHGINIQSGIFMSYVGLWSYYNFDNWTYQPSFVSSNTPWFFNGVRAQIFTSDTLKIEPWIVNGWQSYGKFNDAPGLGLQVQWRPSESFSVLGNQYYGTDTLKSPGRQRYHTDDSVMYRYHRAPASFVDQAAVSLTVDLGCEDGGGVACATQNFVGLMAYHRAWFKNDRFATTLGGGLINNPGRYLVLVPPINGANAFTGAADFTGHDFFGWDVQLTGDYMPTRNVTFRLEYTHRAANVPYFSGAGGLTPPGGNQDPPGSSVAGFTPRPGQDRGSADAGNDDSPLVLRLTSHPKHPSVM